MMYLPRCFRYFLLLVCLAGSGSPLAKEDLSPSGLLSGLRQWGVNQEPEGEQELLPPDQAFGLILRVRDENTVVAEFEPSKNYYLYRDKIVFKSQTAGAAVETITLPDGEKKSDATFGEVEVYRNAFQAVISLKRQTAHDGKLVVAATYQGCNEPVGVCYAPINKVIELTLPAAKAAVNVIAQSVSGEATARPLAEPDATSGLFQTAPDSGLPGNDESARIEQMFASGDFWLILTGFFGIGLLLSFTPCVFPMFPILSGIIASRGEDITRMRGFLLALAYVLGMSLTYAAAGVAAGLSGAMLSAFLQNAWVLGTFALVFVLLAFSMFGFYELQLPGFLQSRLSEEAGQFKGGYLTSVFGMGVLSGLIVGPCVAAPLAGALLYISQTRDVILGGSALFVMALGMGMPLLLLGASAGTLLPKAGAWMESVKRFFGVLLLGVAVYLISPVIPLVVHMLLWAALLIVSAIYLHAVDPLPADAPGLRRFFKGIGIIALLAGTALLVGVLSGSRDILQPLSKLGMTGSVNTGDDRTAVAQADHLPFQRVRSVTELEQRIAQSQGKYVMIEFSADWCISCKEMERFTFSDARVQSRLKDVTLLQVDVTSGTPDDAALLKHFRLFGPPAILFIDRQGKLLSGVRLIGFYDKDRFLGILNTVLI